MNAGQYEGIVGRLDAILSKMPTEGPICTPERRLDHGHTIACGPMAGASSTRETDKLAGAVNALAAMVRAAKDWAEGSAENDEAMGRRDRKPAGEQEFVLVDILNMINDAAREVGVALVYGSVKDA